MNVNAPVSLVFPGLRLPARAIIGLEEEWSLAGEPEVERTWNGRPLLDAPAWGEAMSITLSNSGDNVWTPSLDNLKPGMEVVLYSSHWRSTTLMPGETEVILDRLPVPGTVHARDAEDQRLRVPAGVDGKRVTIPGRAGQTTVHYRSQARCMIGAVKGSGSATGRSQSWSITLEEFPL